MKRIGLFLLYCGFSVVTLVAEFVLSVVDEIADNWRLAGKG